MNKNSQKNRRNSKGNTKSLTPVKRWLIIVGIVTISLIALHVLRPVAHTLLLIFAGMLFAVFLDGLANFLKQQTPISRGWALTLIILLLILFVAAMAWLIGQPIAVQFSKLIELIPQAVENIQRDIMQHELGRQLLSNFTGGESGGEKGMMPSGKAVVQGVTGVFSIIFGTIGSIVIVLFIGIYAASDPGLYINNAIRLFPIPKRERAKELLNMMGLALRRWLAGQLSAMVVVGILTAIGLSIIRMPLVLALALIATLLSFLPFIGPVLSAVPAVLVALVDSPIKAVYVVVVYVIVQTIESYLITPFIQQRAVSFPPAFIISVQILMGVLFGPLGILLATPLAVVAVVLVQMLYVEDVLGDSVEIAGSQNAFNLPFKIF